VFTNDKLEEITRELREARAVYTARMRDYDDLARRQVLADDLPAEKRYQRLAERWTTIEPLARRLREAERAALDYLAGSVPTPNGCEPAGTEQPAIPERNRCPRMVHGRQCNRDRGHGDTCTAWWTP
jgi:hypothetical protein